MFLRNDRFLYPIIVVHVMDKLKILIPPSEGKKEGGIFENDSGFSSITRLLIKKIEAFDGDKEKLYGVKGKNLQKAIKINSKILNSKTLPAIKRYSGVVFNAIDYETLKNKKLFDRRVLIMSAMFGLVKPQDKIPDYKLNIGKLNSDKLWREELKDSLKDHFVIDLLPKAHKKAITYDKGISIDFIIEKDGKRKPAGHDGKFIKGRFVRWLIENEITSIKKFNEFKEDGYFFDGKNFIKKG